MVRDSAAWWLALLCACASSRARPGDAGDGSDLTDAGNGDAGLADLDAGGSNDGGELRVLFIGDSYTYVNDLPGTLERIAATSGVGPAIRVGQVVQGGAALQDQWANGIAQQVILDGGWTHVVLQGQSFEALATLECGSTFQSYARQFGRLIEDAGAIPTWFVTWAYAAGDSIYPGEIDTPAEMQDEVTAGYDSAARDFSSSLLACAGPAFQLALAAHPEIVLQQADLSHPTVAGTYLAACTFYVALTGKPVPEASFIPAGLSVADAAILRGIAGIGSSCAGVQVKGIARLVDGAAFTDATTPDGGAFGYGTAGIPISSTFYLLNLGQTALGLSGATVPPPFEWTSGTYPGGAGGAPGNLSVDCVSIPAGVPYCGAALEPQEGCALSVTYTAASSATAALSIGLSGAYTDSVVRHLSGASTDRALLVVSNSPGFVPCGPLATCDTGDTQVFTDAGSPVPFTVYLGNRGAVTATSMTGDPLPPWLAWAGGGFPGGSDAVEMDAGTFDYCTSPLAPGDFCVMTAQFVPIDAGLFSATLQVSYGDSQGSAAAPAEWAVEGTTPYDSGVHPP